MTAMRILMVHEFYQQPGGEDQSFMSEVEMLRSHGEDVVTWTVHNDDIAGVPLARVALDTVWSRRAARELTKRLDAEGPFDVVHFQNTFPLISPAAVWAAGKSRTAVVQTLRNYRLQCVNGSFFRNGAICELCIDKRLQYPGIMYACYRQSIPASATVVAMNYHSRVRRIYERSVDCFIALSAFARSKYSRMGIEPERITVKPNFLTTDPGVGRGGGGYAIYVGRLSPEKGVSTLLAGWRRLGSQVPLRIVGDGPMAERVKEAASACEGAIEWLGHKTKEEVYGLIGEARFLVFPTEGYETFGRVAIEAFAKGTPVVAADIGPLAELVEQGRTGLRFEPGNPDDLARKVEEFLAAPDHPAWRRRAREEFERKYTADRNYPLLRGIYESAIERKETRRLGPRGEDGGRARR